MENKKLIEIGREILLNNGTIGVILDILTTTKVIIKNIKNIYKNFEISLNNIILLNNKKDITKNIKNEQLMKEINNINLPNYFVKKNKIRETRNNLNDFERFKVKSLKQKKKINKKNINKVFNKNSFN